MSTHQDSESEFLQHVPCPSCGSSDANSLYDDGHQYCFACSTYTPGDGSEVTTQATPTRSTKRMAADLIPMAELEFKALPKRSLNERTAHRWKYGVTRYKGTPAQVACYYSPDGSEVVAQKVRFPDKDFLILGDMKRAGLYGQHLWRDGGKMVVITEGEVDALSVSQLQELKWPVVSIPTGANGAAKAVANQLEWLDGYERVVIAFDNDKPGQEAAAEVAEMLPPGKAYIASFPLKDANEMLVANRGGEVITALWGAKQWMPDGMLAGDDLKQRLYNRPDVTSFAWPDWLPEFQRKTCGFRMGELDTYTSGSGMGKTTLVKLLQYHIFHATPFNQALIHLEEPVEDTAEDLMGLHMQQRIRLPDVRKVMDRKEYDGAFSHLFQAVDIEEHPRLHLYDAFGSLEQNRLYAKIRWFVKALGCKVIWLDHLSILVSDLGEGADERRTIDAIMHNLKELTIELDCYIGLIVHLKKASGTKSFEEGGIPSLDDLRGSGGIKQLSNGVYALSRDQQHPNEIARNTSQVHVLKCRLTGRTGPADFLLFDDITGWMVPGKDPATFAEEDDGGAFADDGEDPF